MMYDSNTPTYDDFTYYMYMPFRKTWDIIDPAQEIIEVRFPGFLIVKHRELEDHCCRGLGHLKSVLRSTVGSVYYK